MRLARWGVEVPRQAGPKGGAVLPTRLYWHDEEQPSASRQERSHVTSRSGHIRGLQRLVLCTSQVHQLSDWSFPSASNPITCRPLLRDYPDARLQAADWRR
jgi:hypothetical protein